MPPFGRHERSTAGRLRRRSSLRGLPSVATNDQRPGGSADGHRSVVSLRSPRNDNSRLYAIHFSVPISPRGYRKVAVDFCSDPVSLPLNKYRKVVADFCSDQGAMKEHSISYVTEEQRRAEQKALDLVCNGFSGNDTQRDEGA